MHWLTVIRELLGQDRKHGTNIKVIRTRNDCRCVVGKASLDLFTCFTWDLMRAWRQFAGGGGGGGGGDEIMISKLTFNYLVNNN